MPAGLSASGGHSGCWACLRWHGLAEAPAQAARPNIGPKTVAAIVEGADNSRMAAVLAADALAGCGPQLVRRAKGEALKQAVLADLAKLQPGSSTPVIERCALGGASR